jgi:hypothetical protein
MLCKCQTVAKVEAYASKWVAMIIRRCPTTDEWIKKMWYLYTMEFYSAMKKEK